MTAMVAMLVVPSMVVGQTATTTTPRTTTTTTSLPTGLQCTGDLLKEFNTLALGIGNCHLRALKGSRRRLRKKGPFDEKACVARLVETFNDATNALTACPSCMQNGIAELRDRAVSVLSDAADLAACETKPDDPFRARARARARFCLKNMFGGGKGFWERRKGSTFFAKVASCQFGAGINAYFRNGVTTEAGIGECISGAEKDFDAGKPRRCRCVRTAPMRTTLVELARALGEHALCQCPLMGPADGRRICDDGRDPCIAYQCDDQCTPYDRPDTNQVPCTDDGNFCTEDKCVVGGCRHIPKVTTLCTNDQGDVDGCHVCKVLLDGYGQQIGSCEPVTAEDCTDGNPETEDLCIPFEVLNPLYSCKHQ